MVSLFFVAALTAPLMLQSPSEQQPEAAPRGARQTEGLFVRRTGDKYPTFVPWESEATANSIFEQLAGIGGEVHFAPGTYVLEQGFEIEGVPDLTISGSPGVELQFAPAPEVEPRTTAPLRRGSTELLVDRPDLMVPGWDYQLYAANGRGDRLLEFTVAAVEGERVLLEKPVAYMPHVKAIPPGCRVLIEVNGFEVQKCPGLVIQSLSIDGRGRGTVRGHTIYSGVIAAGDYRAGRRPRVFGLTIRGCTFRGLMGRGIAFYGLDEVLIENNYFSAIRAQAIEVDHFSSGHVLFNYVNRAQSGVTLNDSFKALVEGNTLANCDFGVYFMKVFEQRWVNTDNEVVNNTFGPGCVRAVVFRDPGIEGNRIRGNRFIGLHERFRVVQAKPAEVAPAEPED